MCVYRLLQNGPKCFSLFGIDVMIDSKLQPWLLELNGVCVCVRGCVFVCRLLQNGPVCGCVGVWVCGCSVCGSSSSMVRDGVLVCVFVCVFVSLCVYTDSCKTDLCVFVCMYMAPRA